MKTGQNSNGGKISLRFVKNMMLSRQMPVYKFAMTPPGVISISLNTSNPARVKENVAIVECKIPPDFWKEMR